MNEPPETSPDLLAPEDQPYRRIVENSREAILVARGPRIRFCNARAVELSGYSREELHGLSWLRLVHADDRQMLLWRCKNTPSAGAVVLRIHDRAGALKWLEIYREPTRWENRPAVLAFISDITDRKRLEQKFVQAQKMEAVGRLAGGIAHDFNNFLTVIRGYSELLEVNEQQAPEDAERIRAIRETVQKASALTHGLLAFSRKQHLEPEILDLSRLLAGAESMLKQLLGEGIEIVIRSDPGLGLIRADAGGLQQIILNLAVNSKDAMERGGKMIIAAENAVFSESSQKPKPELRPGEYVTLSVSDTGSGMSEETMAHLFEPFFTTKEKGRGTGLGLATVYGIVKQSNGHIYAYSEPGRGSIFKLYFPRVDGIQPRPGERRGSRGQFQGSETVLVVEDDEQVLRIIEAMLKRGGYTVFCAGNGKTALRLSEQARDPIHLLITDLGVPDMDGREVWEAVKRIHPAIAVLFISGYPQDFLSLRTLEATKRTFLQKPFDFGLLMQRVRETLDGG